MGFNVNHHSVKRILREVKEFQKEQDPDLVAVPLEDDLFEWHFTMRGPPDSEFEGGIYHGRVLLPIDYPLKPPDIVVLTPSGRFVPGKKICLSNSSYHPENWQPAWSIRTALLALRSFMPSAAKGAVGSLNQSKEVREELAKKSHDWKCDHCKKLNKELLPPPPSPPEDEGDSHEGDPEQVGPIHAEEMTDDSSSQDRGTPDNLTETSPTEETPEATEEKQEAIQREPYIEPIPMGGGGLVQRHPVPAPAPTTPPQRAAPVAHNPNQFQNQNQNQNQQIQYQRHYQNHPAQGHVVHRELNISPLLIDLVLVILLCVFVILLLRRFAL